MSLKWHLILGTAASAALWQALGVNSVFFWAASFAIDIDHYLDFVFRSGFRAFGVGKMFDYHRELMKSWYSPEFLNIEAFHTLEFIVPLYAYALLSGSSVLNAVCLGLVFHNVLDMAFLLGHGIFTKRAYSFIEYLIRKKRLEDAGLNPSEVYRSAIRAVVRS